MKQRSNKNRDLQKIIEKQYNDNEKIKIGDWKKEGGQKPVGK